MTPIQLQPLVDHIWQSTLFAVVAGAITLALRNNRAQVRYWLWFSASVKFLVPFSLLAASGTYFSRHSIVTVVPSRLPVMADRFTESFVVSPFIAMTTPASAAVPGSLILAAFGLVWAVGFIVLVSSWCLRWRHIRSVLKAASPVQLPINLKAMSSPVIHGTWRVWHLRSRFVVT
jgi:bla regulator protein BlaR1